MVFKRYLKRQECCINTKLKYLRYLLQFIRKLKNLKIYKNFIRSEIKMAKVMTRESLAREVASNTVAQKYAKRK